MTSPKLKTPSYRNHSARYSRPADAVLGLPLLVRSAPKQDESLMGYLVRLTEENRYDSPSWILLLANMGYVNNRSCAFIYKPAVRLSALATLTGNNLSDLEAATYQWAGFHGREDIALFYKSPLYKFLLHPERPKVCPDCLSEIGYCRRVWDMALATTCPLHRRLLIDSCPKCELPIRNNRSRVSICTCGYDYRLASAPHVQENELDLTRQAYRLCGLSGPKGNRISTSSQGNSPALQLNLFDLATLLVFVAVQHDEMLTITGKKYVQSRSNAELHKAFVKAYRIFGEWPDRYFEFLDWRQQQDDSSRLSKGLHRSGLGKCFGSFYEGIFWRLASPNFEFLREAFGYYAENFWQAGYVSKSRWSSATSHKPLYLARDDARRELAVEHKYIDNLVAVGALKAVVRQTGKYRVFLVDASSLAAIKREHINAIKIREVAKRLDVNMSVVVKLVSRFC